MEKYIVKRVGEELTQVEPPEGDTLSWLQSMVDGYVEMVRLPKNVDMYVNDGFLLNGSAPNFGLVHNGVPITVVHGDAVFASADKEGNTIPLSEEQVQYVENMRSIERISFDENGKAHSLIWYMI